MPADPFAIAGQAACLLEDMGFVAVARKRDGRVTLELWRVVQGEQRAIRVDVAGDGHEGIPATSAEALAEACAARFHAALLRHQT